MDTVIAALAPIFVLSLTVQTFHEWIDPVLDVVADLWANGRKRVTQQSKRGQSSTTENDEKKLRKKAVVHFSSLILAAILVAVLDVKFLTGMMVVLDDVAKEMIGIDISKIPQLADRLVGAFIIAGGTEVTNSIVKFLGYKKDEAGSEDDSGNQNDD